MTKHETERLAVVEQKLNDHDRRFDELTVLVKEGHSKLDGNHDMMRAYIDAQMEIAEKKFASKNTEKIVYGMVSTIVLAVLYAVLEGVVK